MDYSRKFDERRRENVKALAAFAVEPLSDKEANGYREVLAGGKVTIFTVGYEKRSGDDLIHLLINAGVKTLVDVRQRPMSRKADFRKAALQARCEDAGIDYLGMPELGSTDSLRDELHESKDFAAFHQQFETYARTNLSKPIESLTKVARTSTVALICFERRHEECHRSVIAKLAAEQLRATIVAIS